MAKLPSVDRPLIVGLNAVLVAVTDGTPLVLTVSPRRDELPESVLPALPFGPFDAVGDRTLERGLRRWVNERTGLELGYVEQLYTFGDRFRDPREREGGPRLLSIGYLALVCAPPAATHADPIDWYRFFPWEDHREGYPQLIEAEILPQLTAWLAKTPRSFRAAREERLRHAFPKRREPWNDELVLERYELLYEAELIAEAGATGVGLGEAMALDHRRILATAIARLRGKIKYRPLVFELLAPTFSLLDLQITVEALAGRRLHKQNFRRLVELTGLVERTAMRISSTGGRPAQAYRFRREAFAERPPPGVRLPALRRNRRLHVE